MSDIVDRTLRVVGGVLDRIAIAGAPMQPQVQAGIAAAAAQDMGARCTAAAEMFPQHTKTSAPGQLSPVVADRPGPVSADGLSSVGPGHSTSAAHGVAVGPGSATPLAGSGHPHLASEDLAIAAECLHRLASGGEEPPYSSVHLQAIAERLDDAAQK